MKESRLEGLKRLAKDVDIAIKVEVDPKEKKYLEDMLNETNRMIQEELKAK